MDVSVSGEFLYLFSGRNVVCTSHAESKDPYAVVQAIRLSAVTSVKIDQQEQSITLTVAGSLHPIVCTAGNSPNARVNWFFNFTQKFLEAFPELSANLVWNPPERTWYSANCSTREDDIDVD
jgi:hypothetical protein